MIILTGGAGFIGRNVLSELNDRGINDIVVVDNIGTSNKWRNILGLKFSEYVHKSNFNDWLINSTDKDIDAIIHLGACSSTVEKDFDYLYQNNVEYSKMLWKIAAAKEIPFIYASSAATYGDGSRGYDDDHGKIDSLHPLNAYGLSKHLFDLWAIRQESSPPKWVGLKYFNVFGPYEGHKGTMASVAYHGYNQIKEYGGIKLFKSYHADYGDGEQRRDFIFVEDVTRLTLMPLKEDVPLGIYNVGTGKSRTFNELANCLFAGVGLPAKVKYIDMPEGLKNKYQYYTESNNTKSKLLRGKNFKYSSLEAGVAKYIEFLKLQK